MFSLFWHKNLKSPTARPRLPGRPFLRSSACTDSSPALYLCLCDRYNQWRSARLERFGSKTNNRDENMDQDSMFSQAAELLNGNDALGVLAMLEDCPSLGSATDAYGSTLLMRALKTRQLSLALRIMPFSDASQKNEKGWTALMLAADLGLDECARALLPLSDPNACDPNQMTALMHAAKNGHEECVKILLQAADPLAKNKLGATALMIAAGWIHPGCVEVLIPHSDLSAANSEGTTALMIAAGRGLVSAVRMMLPFCDPNAANKRGWTALSTAAAQGRYDCVEALLPVSDASLRATYGNDGAPFLTAAEHALDVKAMDVAALIEVFETSKFEKEAIGDAIVFDGSSREDQAPARLRL